MSDNEKKVPEEVSGNIAEILRERDRLDQVLKKKFKKEVTILFTDICGYTKYTDTMGDIRSRAMIQKHNDIIFPIVEKHDGTVIKTIGDAVMATFSDPLSATKASIDIQNDLTEYNLHVDASDEIHVKMGINTGEVLMDKDDVFGDAVNVASRIQSQAEKDQILISESAYHEVCGSEDIICRSHGSVRVKGKANALELYKVVWQDRDIILSAEPRLRGGEPAHELRVERQLRLLQLELTRENGNLKISAYEQSSGDVSTIRQYEELPFSTDEVETRCNEIVDTLNKANRKGRLSREILIKLREIGRSFYDDLFSSSVRERINKTDADHLILNLDDQLVHVPWELFHDGKQFLCQKFNMGRLVKTRQNITEGKSRLLDKPLKMLVIADPKGDLNGAHQEGVQIWDKIHKESDIINVSLRSDNVTPNFIKKKLRNFDLVHFAGHADYNLQDPEESSWILSEGVLKAHDIKGMAGKAPMPALVFTNACQSARTNEWDIKDKFHNEIFGFANAFMLAGVKHYVGTFWEILDEPSSRFALEFYHQLLSNMTIGEAMRNSRLSLIDRFGEETIVWASYLLYGDPTYNYMEQVRKDVPEDKVHPIPKKETIRAEEKIDVKQAKKQKEIKKYRWLLASVAFCIVVLGFLLWGYPGFLREGTQKYEDALIGYYNGGNFEEAFASAKALEEKNSKISLAYLIQGNILFGRGLINDAENAYQKAIEAPKGTGAQKSEAFIGLGRIASINKHPERALAYYQKATELTPEGSRGYLAQGILFEKQGDYDKALGFLKKAQETSSNDHSIVAITTETRKKAELVRDQEKQERVDRLVRELLDNMNSVPKEPTKDEWTSRPLTLWLMDLKSTGYSLQEGEEELIIFSLTDRLIEHNRVQVVERAILDKLLEEMKLSNTNLVDQRTALALGRILAARLILSGQIFYSGPQKQVSMRLIETETGRIMASLNETFGSAISASILAQRLSSELLAKVEELYPLRGKISEVKEGEITLNIGRREGVQIGQSFIVEDNKTVLEIVGIDVESSVARSMEESAELKKDLRVQLNQ